MLLHLRAQACADLADAYPVGILGGVEFLLVFESERVLVLLEEPLCTRLVVARDLGRATPIPRR
ncbi:MAG: hypothetical protein HND48_24495 [Chloroflexi bacterium]|nr:hypothetical protein [Chloroflexota bacterium]